MPPTFPLGSWDTTHKLLGELSHVAGWHGAARAFNGVAFRFRGAVESSDQFAAVFAKSFGGDERFAEENALFNVFGNAVSTLECAAFGIFHLGAMVADGHLPREAPLAKKPAKGAKPSHNPNARRFPIATGGDLRRIKLDTTAAAFEEHFQNSELCEALARCLSDPQRKRLYSWRHVLLHRESPARHHHLGGAVDGTVHVSPENTTRVTIDADPEVPEAGPNPITLDASFASSHVGIMTRVLTDLLGATAAFAQRELPKLKARVPRR